MTVENDYDENCIESKCNLLYSCTNTPKKSDSISSGVITDIPILLSTQIVELCLISLIRLPEKASGINSIENKIIITDCKLLKDSNVLFIKGFVRKSIYYNSSGISEDIAIHDSLKYCLACVPFECSANIELNDSTTLPNTDSISPNQKSSEKNSKLIFSNRDYELSWTTPHNLNKISEEIFNTKNFCELVKSVIVEQCKYIYRKTYSAPSKAIDLTEIIELDDFMSIKLEIQIFKNQEVYIKPCCLINKISPPCSHDCSFTPKTDMIDESDSDDNITCNDEDNPSSSSSYNNSHTSSSLTLHEFLYIALFILLLNLLDPYFIHELLQDSLNINREVSE
ncbi:hypothetical protein [Wukongibacter sp. M2B1]|uniref:hypothetical protein n=1 Tax=Wukongibacter sp. M2B1 TaxID=3088895 RepID=UPI003D797FC5